MMTDQIDNEAELAEAMAEVRLLVNKIGKLFDKGDYDYNTVFLTLSSMLLLHIQNHADDDDTAMMSIAFVTEQLTTIAVNIAKGQGAGATLQ
jgi:hypothetical protein